MVNSLGLIASASVGVVKAIVFRDAAHHGLFRRAFRHDGPALRRGTHEPGHDTVCAFHQPAPSFRDILACLAQWKAPLWWDY